MLKTIAEELSLRMVANKIILIEDRKFYIYGIEVILNDLLIFSSVALIAILSKTVITSLIFTIIFCSLRAYVGGYHCKTCARCFCTTMALYISMIILNTYLVSTKFMISCILIGISVSVIFVFAPFEYNNSLTYTKRRRYRKFSIILTLVAILSFIISIAFHKFEISFAISWATFAVLFLLMLSILSKLLQSRREKDVKQTSSQISFQHGETGN